MEQEILIKICQTLPRLKNVESCKGLKENPVNVIFFLEVFKTSGNKPSLKSKFVVVYNDIIMWVKCFKDLMINF